MRMHKTMVEPPTPALHARATPRLLGPEHWKCRAISSLFVTPAYAALEAPIGWRNSEGLAPSLADKRPPAMAI
jgi:hypothetical protein